MTAALLRSLPEQCAHCGSVSMATVEATAVAVRGEDGHVAMGRAPKTYVAWCTKCGRVDGVACTRCHGTGTAQVEQADQYGEQETIDVRCDCGAGGG